MSAAPDIRTAALKADLILTETVRIEGALRAIHDVGGIQAAETAANAALRRVVRASNDNSEWIS